MDEAKLREQLASSLSGRGAHVGFDHAVKGFTTAAAGRRVPGLAHTAWQLVWPSWERSSPAPSVAGEPPACSRPWPCGGWNSTMVAFARPPAPTPAAAPAPAQDAPSLETQHV